MKDKGEGLDNTEIFKLKYDPSVYDKIDLLKKLPRQSASHIDGNRGLAWIVGKDQEFLGKTLQNIEEEENAVEAIELIRKDLLRDENWELGQQIIKRALESKVRLSESLDVLHDFTILGTEKIDTSEDIHVRPKVWYEARRGVNNQNVYFLFDFSPYFENKGENDDYEIPRSQKRFKHIEDVIEILRDDEEIEIPLNNNSIKLGGFFDLPENVERLRG